MKLQLKFCAEDLHPTYCRYFQMNCCFDVVFLMALTFTEQLYIEYKKTFM